MPPRRARASWRRASRSATQQIVQEWIAESRAEIDAARLMVLRRRVEDRHARARTRRARRSRIIKFFVAGVLQRVLDRAIQVHGALGMTDDTPLAYWYRHERARAHLRRARRGAQDASWPSASCASYGVTGVRSSEAPIDADQRAVRAGEELDAERAGGTSCATCPS